MSSKDLLYAQKRWHLTLMLCLLIVSGSTSVSYGQSTPYPPSDALVDAGGHLLHIRIMGKGKPVVVFENESGDFSFIWDLVQPEVSKTVTTVY